MNQKRSAKLLMNWIYQKEKQEQALLERVQRLVYVGITGALCACPTIALEVPLHLTPLHIQVNKETMIDAIIKLEQNIVLKLTDLIRQLKILHEVAKLIDQMTPRFNLG